MERMRTRQRSHDGGVPPYLLWRMGHSHPPLPVIPIPFPRPIEFARSESFTHLSLPRPYSLSFFGM